MGAPWGLTRVIIQLSPSSFPRDFGALAARVPLSVPRKMCQEITPVTQSLCIVIDSSIRKSRPLGQMQTRQLARHAFRS